MADAGRGHPSSGPEAIRVGAIHPGFVMTQLAGTARFAHRHSRVDDFAVPIGENGGIKQPAAASALALAAGLIAMAAIYLYLRVGTTIGATWSSLDGSGPQWPMTVSFLGFYLAVLAAAVLVVLAVIACIREVVWRLRPEG